MGNAFLDWKNVSDSSSSTDSRVAVAAPAMLNDSIQDAIKSFTGILDSYKDKRTSWNNSNYLDAVNSYDNAEDLKQSYQSGALAQLRNALLKEEKGFVSRDVLGNAARNKLNALYQQKRDEQRFNAQMEASNLSNIASQMAINKEKEELENKARQQKLLKAMSEASSKHNKSTEERNTSELNLRQILGKDGESYIAIDKNGNLDAKATARNLGGINTSNANTLAEYNKRRDAAFKQIDTEAEIKAKSEKESKSNLSSSLGAHEFFDPRTNKVRSLRNRYYIPPTNNSKSPEQLKKDWDLKNPAPKPAQDYMADPLVAKMLNESLGVIGNYVSDTDFANNFTNNLIANGELPQNVMVARQMLQSLTGTPFGDSATPLIGQDKRNYDRQEAEEKALEESALNDTYEVFNKKLSESIKNSNWLAKGDKYEWTRENVIQQFNRLKDTTVELVNEKGETKKVKLTGDLLLKTVNLLESPLTWAEDEENIKEQIIDILNSAPNLVKEAVKIAALQLKASVNKHQNKGK